MHSITQNFSKWHKSITNVFVVMKLITGCLSFDDSGAALKYQLFLNALKNRT